MAHKPTPGKDTATPRRGGLASVCSYESPSPEPEPSRDALETVSNDSLVSYSPPALSPVPVEPYAPVVKAPSLPAEPRKTGSGEETKKHVRRRRSKDKIHRRRSSRRSKTPGDAGHHSTRKKKRRHTQQDPGSPRGQRSKKSKQKRHHHHHHHRHHGSSTGKDIKVVPRSYRSPSPDKGHRYRSPSSERGPWQHEEPAYDDISSPGSPYNIMRDGRRGSPFNNYNRRSPLHIRRSPSPHGRHGHSPGYRHRSPSPYYGPNRSPSPRFAGRYNSLSPPPHKRYRISPPPHRHRITPPRRRRGRGYSPRGRGGGYRRTSSPDERDRRHYPHYSSPPPPPSRSRTLTSSSSTTATVESRVRKDSLIDNKIRTEKKTKKMTVSSGPGSSNISWNKSAAAAAAAADDGNKTCDIEATDSGKLTSTTTSDPSNVAMETEEVQSKETSSTDQVKKEEEEEKVVKEVDTVPEPSDKAPPLPSDAPPPPPPPDENEKPPLPPVPSLPLFIPPPSLLSADKPSSEHSSNTPLDRSTDKSRSGSPRKQSISPINTGASPTSSPHPQPATQTDAMATPVLPQAPLQPREHKPRCIDAFEIIDQIGEGTYGKVRILTHIPFLLPW